MAETTAEQANHTDQKVLESLRSSLDNAIKRVMVIQTELDQAHRWRDSLYMAADVARYLFDRTTFDGIPPRRGRRGHWKAPPQQRGRKRGAASVAAEPALIAMLQSSRQPIKQEEAVRRLEVEHGIIVGSTSPKRRTSDLSATLRRIKGTPLRVSRVRGWTLAEWEGDQA